MSDNFKELIKIEKKIGICPSANHVLVDKKWKISKEDSIKKQEQEINLQTQQAIFEKLGVDNTNDALIKQVMKISSAVAFLADKTDRRTLNEQEKTGLNNALVDYNNINDIVKKGKEKKELI